MQPQANTSNLFTLFKIHKYGGNTNSYRTDKLAWLPQKCVEPKTSMTFKLGENQMKIFTQEVANVLSYRWQWNEMTRPASEVHHKSHISAGIFHKRGNYRTSDQDFVFTKVERMKTNQSISPTNDLSLPKHHLSHQNKNLHQFPSHQSITVLFKRHMLRI